MVSKGMLWLATSGVSLATFGQAALKMAPIPSDPLEIVTGPIQAVDTPAGRLAVVQLLARARKNYALESAGRGYQLKVNFTVNSGGQTDYDGAWRMEDVFDPRQGLHWTATAAAGYATTQILSNRTAYGEGTASVIPLRLQEARVALLGAIPSAANVARESIRTSIAIFHGAQLTCVLLSGSRIAAETPGRQWEETEECIDPQSGLLQVHSQVPGRYYAYEYSDGLQLGDHVLPQKVIVTEAGKTISEITVESLTEVASADAKLFVPSEEMKARGPAVAMAGAEKLERLAGKRPFAAGGTAQPVCVFGLVTPSGQLVEAHSLQPSDPNSQAAVDAVKRMNFTRPAPPGERPSQHFVFVIEKFVSSP
ncbi:MAG: hypothetical protein ABSF12_01095 [Bryobacteraceae bacterium]|jgi:hypothetical protein